VPKTKPLCRAVFDCMIFVQGAARVKNPANACFELVENGEVSLFVSQEIIDEVKDVLSRRQLRNRFPALTDEIGEVFLKEVLSKSKQLKNARPVFKYARDRKDEKYLNLAIEAEADFIVSRDKDLLDLMTGIDDKSKEFRQRFRRLKIVKPVEFLNILAEKHLPLKR